MDYSLSEPNPDLAAEIDEWLLDYVGLPHAELGRDGPICPFVIPALRADSLIIRSHQWRGQHELDLMTGLIERIVAEFERQTRSDSGNPNLHTLVVVITGLPESAWWLIDEGHRRAKDFVIERGYMLGQFHPGCEEPSVHNPFFMVNQAPHPIFAVRHMALHDILFLHHEQSWFEEYRERFAHKFAEVSPVADYLHDLFDASSKKYSRKEKKS